MSIPHEIAQQIVQGKHLWPSIATVEGEPITLPDLQNWFRREHDIYIVIDREGLDSNEMCYVYEVTYLKPEDQGTKHWVGALTRKRSFHGYGSSYGGGWNKYEEALEAAIDFAWTLIQKP